MSPSDLSRTNFKATCELACLDDLAMMLGVLYERLRPAHLDVAIQIRHAAEQLVLDIQAKRARNNPRG